ncbi:hypothetical protein SLS53_007668 [Cytospora paraplurivora]|uniref:Glycoside hydrolase 131 catalytic N-terminal domain-containing protein n=1 Tax=Cytospora paraplurivora TaxID=2898453 RepID=A0AAN9YDT8_9PEZI
MKALSLAALAAILATVNAGTVLWDGRFNDLSSSTDLDNWSWSNEVGPYQYYIHGSGNVTEYVNLSPSYKNPADSSSKQGVKITLDSTSYWNGQTMRRTELIPQTSAAINSGKVWYHLSIMANATNFPSIYREHQIAFFESHFTELKAGWISGESATNDTNLQWFAGGTSQWETNFTAGVWHNVAYEIDFDAGTVGFWHSTGGDDLVLTVEPVMASTSSDGADWHLGVLELQRDGYDDADEDLYFSGVYVESGNLTTSVSGPAEHHTLYFNRVHGFRSYDHILSGIDKQQQHRVVRNGDLYVRCGQIRTVWWDWLDWMLCVCFGEYVHIRKRLLFSVFVVGRGCLAGRTG